MRGRSRSKNGVALLAAGTAARFALILNRTFHAADCQRRHDMPCSAELAHKESHDGSRQPGPSRLRDHRHRLAGRLPRLHPAVAGRRACAFRLQRRDAGAVVRHHRAGAGQPSAGVALSAGVWRRLDAVLRAGLLGPSHRLGTRPRQQHDAWNGCGDDQHRLRGAADPALRVWAARRSPRRHRHPVRGGDHVSRNRDPAGKRTTPSREAVGALRRPRQVRSCSIRWCCRPRSALRGRSRA